MQSLMRYASVLFAACLLIGCPTAPNDAYMAPPMIDGGDGERPDADPGQPDAAELCDGPSDCSGTTPFCDIGEGVCTSDCTVVIGDAAARDQACSDASASTPRCSADIGACVACLDSSDCVGSADGAVCETEPGAGQYSCRGCSADNECDTQVCKRADGDEFGACASAGEVLYVSQDGDADADCSIDAPCVAIGEALDIAASANAKRYIRILDGGNYGERLTFDGDMDITIVGRGDLVGLVSGMPIIVVNDDAVVELRELTVRAAADGVSGINCVTSGAAQVKLRDATVSTGINGGVGVSVNQCFLDVSRSEIRANGAGGINISNSDFLISNSLIQGNGRSDSSFGGIQIGNSTALDVTVQSMVFNTVIDNDSLDTATASGVFCSGKAGTPIIAHSNIVRGGDSAADTIAGSNCTFTHSNIEGLEALRASLPGVLDDASNVDGEPMFTNAASGDYSLLPADTSCTNQGKPDTGVTVDINGAARPQGGANPDIGAYEVSEAAN